MTKIFYGNQYVEKFNCDGRKYSKFQIFRIKAMRYVKRTLLVMSIFSLTGWGVYVGSNYIPRTVYADKEVVKEVIKEINAPVLDRIAKCESGNSHFDKNGQVLMRTNDNKSVDIGVMQINVSIWGKTATKMGYNLSIEKDNRNFAKYLYENYGTEPWVWSKACWNK